MAMRRSLGVRRRGKGVAVGAVAVSGGDGHVRVRGAEREREAGNGDASKKVGLGNVRGVPSQLQAVGGKQEEAWRLARACAVPPLPTGRGWG